MRSGSLGQGYAYVDGNYCSLDAARLSVLDQGFTHSDAVYDVVSVWKGQFFRLADHITRFLASCRSWGLTCQPNSREIETILAQCVVRGGVSNAAYVAIVATRGRYASDDAHLRRDLLDTLGTLLAYALPYQWIMPPEAQERGAHVIVAKTPRIPEACVSSKCKNYHWGDLTRGKLEARALGADEAVHLTVDGTLTEGAGFNIFFVKSGRAYTPARNVLEGITRSSAMMLAAQLNIPVETGDFTATQFRACDEAFMTSTAGGIMPVSMIDNRPLSGGGPGRLSLALRDLYWKRREKGWLSTPLESLLHESTRASEGQTE